MTSKGIMVLLKIPGITTEQQRTTLLDGVPFRPLAD